MTDSGRSEIERYLYSLVARGAYTRFQLECKLQARTADGDLVEELLETCEQAGYIDDDLYARLFVESREDWSRRRLVDELQKRGIDRGMAREVVSDSVGDERTRAETLAKGWSAQRVEPRKIAGRLLRRGFPEHLVREIVTALE